MPSAPLFSVIVPTYTRPAYLRACLGGFVAIEFPRNQFEIVVVDDGSPVSPQTLVDEFRDKFSISLITQQHAGPAAARNMGARCSRGVYLAFTDDDCVPSPGWLDALSEQFGLSADCLAGGPIVN